ncbi:MAG: hypothetical protein KJZ58_05595, partial [Flavobacteriales bacterium]|nr:hypothetical protein [Flavobacteriales bacterium]
RNESDGKSKSLNLTQNLRGLKDLVAEACRRLIEGPRERRKVVAKKLPFPLFKGGRPAKPGEEMTPDRVAEILWGSGE